jgi:hypothetical protein
MGRRTRNRPCLKRLRGPHGVGVGELSGHRRNAGSSCLRCGPLLSDAVLERERHDRLPGYDLNANPLGNPQVVSMNGVLASGAVNCALALVTGYSNGARGATWWGSTTVDQDRFRDANTAPSTRLSLLRGAGLGGPSTDERRDDEGQESIPRLLKGACDWVPGGGKLHKCNPQLSVAICELFGILTSHEDDSRIDSFKRTKGPSRDLLRRIRVRWLSSGR